MTKRKAPNMPRQMWTQEEDRSLLKAVKTHCNLTWNDLAKKLGESKVGMKKSGKQCRERYRNYLNPHVVAKPWSRDEKILFILLHNYYANHWGEIAYFYPDRNDIAMKNFFYSYMRKVLKKIRTHPCAAFQPLHTWKVLELYYILELIRLKYLPRLQSAELSSTVQDTTIMSVLRLNKLDERVLARHTAKLLRTLQQINKSANYPLVLRINPEKFDWNQDKRRKLDEVVGQQYFGEVSQFLIIKLNDASKTPNTQKPNQRQEILEPSNLPQSNLPSPNANSFKIPYYSAVSPPFQIVTPSSSNILEQCEKPLEYGIKENKRTIKSDISYVYSAPNGFQSCPMVLYFMAKPFVRPVCTPYPLFTINKEADRPPIAGYQPVQIKYYNQGIFEAPPRDANSALTEVERMTCKEQKLSSKTRKRRSTKKTN